MDFGKCVKCKKKALIAIDAGKTPLCAYHYVEREDEECLKSFLQSEIEEYGKIKKPKEI